MRSNYASSIRARRIDPGAHAWSSHLLCGVWTRLTSPGAGRIVDAFVGYAADAGLDCVLPMPMFV